MAQYPKDDPADDVKRTTNFPQLKTLVMTPIAGAPILSQPQRIDGDKLEIRTGKHGLCYPAVYDWNHDGLSDLILGEFSTGKIENNLKIYLNKGTKKKPKFTGEYFYGKDTRDSIITNYQWCCIGIHPRFVDITGDGKLDIISGQYFPGAISLWRGNGEGFLPHEYIPQEAYSDGWFQGPDTSKPDNHSYWNYTSANFADYNGDGLVDLFVGGCGGLRVALQAQSRALDARLHPVGTHVGHVGHHILGGLRISVVEFEQIVPLLERHVDVNLGQRLTLLVPHIVVSGAHHTPLAAQDEVENSVSVAHVHQSVTVVVGKVC
jgi:hypothetical protein